MNKYILGIDGMGCGMCEAHVENIIRKNIKAKRIKASHLKNTLIVITEKNMVEVDFKNLLDSSGYKVTSFERTVAVKKWYGYR